MAECIIANSGSDVSSEDVTASRAQVLKGYTTITSDSDGEIVEGTLPTKGETIYNTSSTDQKIDKGVYLEGDQTIKAVKVSNILAENVRKGVTIQVGDANNAGRIAKVSGTWYGSKTTIFAMAARGFGVDSSDWETYQENLFTMPADGTIYYGGMSAGYGSTSTTRCEIWRGGTLVDSRNITNHNYGYRGSMFNQSFSAKAGETIKVVAAATNGTHAQSCIQAIIVY